MKFSIPTKTTTETWGMGMGFLLIFFPEEHHQQIRKKSHNFTTNLLSQSIFGTQILYSTLSICLLLLFTTALLFTLSSTLPSSRRQMLQELSRPNSNLSHALQRMGVLYRRGTRAMNDVVVAHALDSLTLHDIRLFVRLFLRSSLAARADLVLVFPARTAALGAAILRENDSFIKLLARYSRNSNIRNDFSNPFDFAHFVKVSSKEKEIREPIWGRRIRHNSSAAGEAEAELKTPPSYGSVVGFDVDELDPENSLSGFFQNVPMSFRRWACYPMLLGRVRRNFKHVMLVDVKEFLLLGDPLARVRILSPESILLHLSKRGRKNPYSTRPKSVNPGIIMGGSRGIRRLSSEMLTGIVRSSMQRNKRKNPITESVLLSQLVENNFVLRNVNLVVAPESVPELGSHTGSGLKSGMIRKGNSNLDFHSVVMKHICSFPVDSTVYSDC